jgi:hypothetical protein
MHANDLMYFRILNQLISTMGDLLLAGMLIYFLKITGTGHQRLMFLSAIMFITRSISLLFGARAVYIHNHHISVWFSLVSSAFILVTAAYTFITRSDIRKTLCRSEAIDQIWRWRIANAQQVAINSVYIAEQTAENVSLLTPKG